VGPERAEAIIQNDVREQPAVSSEPLRLVENSTIQSTAWRGKAACKGTDPDIFYPVNEDGAEEAKAVCRGCPVRRQCLEYALANLEKEGVWGGLTVRERRAILRNSSKKQ
jgi:WhiB family redox-sensing transcriptional regulator